MTRTMPYGGFVPGCAMCTQGFCMEHYHVDTVTSCASGSALQREAGMSLAESDEVLAEAWKRMKSARMTWRQP